MRRARGDDAPLRVLYMGRLDRQKGIDRLHGAFALLRERGVSFEARVVGSEILADAAGSWAQRLRDCGVDVRPAVFQTRDLAALLAWGDVLIMPSRWEGAPLMIPEAQQLGCVPVVTAVGAVGELIADGVDGLLIEPVSDAWVVERLAEAVGQLAGDCDRLASLIDGCLQTAARRSWPASFSEFLTWCAEHVGCQPQMPPLPTVPASEPDRHLRV